MYTKAGYTKKLSNNGMKRSVSADAISDIAAYYQSFTASHASVNSIPCIVRTIVDSKINKSYSEEDLTKNLGVCLASPPDVKIQEDENTNGSTVIERRRRQKGDSELPKYQIDYC